MREIAHLTSFDSHLILFRVVRALIVSVLVLAMCPAASELLEVGLHMVRHGDYAHADEHDHNETSPNEEHGCSELFHRCACHAQVTPLLQPASLLVWSAEPRVVRARTTRDSAPGLDDPEPPVRPPIAARA